MSSAGNRSVVLDLSQSGCTIESMGGTWISHKKPLSCEKKVSGGDQRLLQQSCSGKAFFCRHAAFMLSLLVCKQLSQNPTHPDSNGWRRCEMTTWKAILSVLSSPASATMSYRWGAFTNTVRWQYCDSQLLVVIVLRIPRYRRNRRPLLLLVFWIAFRTRFERDCLVVERWPWLQLTHRPVDGAWVSTRCFHPHADSWYAYWRVCSVHALFHHPETKLPTILIVGTTLPTLSSWTR